MKNIIQFLPSHSFYHITIRNVQFSGYILLRKVPALLLFFVQKLHHCIYPAHTQTQPNFLIIWSSFEHILIITSKQHPLFLAQTIQLCYLFLHNLSSFAIYFHTIYPALSDHIVTIFIIPSIAYVLLVCILI